jgi:hypothetical protein
LLKEKQLLELRIKKKQRESTSSAHSHVKKIPSEIKSPKFEQQKPLETLLQQQQPKQSRQPQLVKSEQTTVTIENLQEALAIEKKEKGNVRVRAVFFSLPCLLNLFVV